MARMSVAYRGDVSGVAGSSEPITDGSANPAAGDRGLAFGRLAGNQQKHPNSSVYRPFKPFVQQSVGGSEIVAMKIDRHFRLNESAAKAAVPATVQRIAGLPSGRRGRRPSRLPESGRWWWSRFLLHFGLVRLRFGCG